MYKVLLFAGTTEGRRVAEYLNHHKIATRVCVATEYGESLLPQGEYLEITHQRLNSDEMEELMWKMEDGGLVIDATHPYAAVVSENIEKACANTATAYLRVIREDSQMGEAFDSSCQDVVFVGGTREAVEYLEHTEGKILVATGSKELAAYTAITDYQTRVYARVLSLVEVVKSCAALGFEGKHLICMQGPFSMEMNIALLRQVKASWLVTKESGNAGGFIEKYLAAKECGCKLLVIGRPRKEAGLTIDECLEHLKKRFQLEDDKTAVSQKISLVGIGMGAESTLTIEGRAALNEAQLLIGAERMLENVKQSGQECFAAYKPEVICDCIRSHASCAKIAIALSGDVGFYSGAKKLIDRINEEFPEADLQVYCGISSMIYFCSKLKTAWEDVLPISLHGRNRNLIGLLQHHPRIFAIVGNRTGVGDICKKLVAYGMGDTRVSIGECLSYPDEAIRCGTASDFTDEETQILSVVLVERTTPVLPWTGCVTHGIPDEAFLRDKVPMTKEEVRSISLSKMHLFKDSVIYDVGAGTGSVSVEMALMAVDGEVYAIEKKPEAAALIEKNKQKFCVDNLTVIRGTAPEALENLPVPTHAFIGGSSGNLSAILAVLFKKNPKLRVVINCITLETVAEAMHWLGEWEQGTLAEDLTITDLDIAQVNVAKGKKAGPYHLMMGQNPVYVISFCGAVRQMR